MKKVIILGLLTLIFIPNPTIAQSVSLINIMNLDSLDGASVAVGDLGEDGVAEIVIGSGFGVPPEVKIFRQDGSLINSFLAYDKNFNRGIQVALGDVDGDGVNDIITAPAYGGGPHIRVFDSYGNLHNEFFAYNPAFRGGAFVTARDVNDDGKAEIITGAGPTGGSHVRVFQADGTLLHEFFAFEPGDISGVTVGAITIDGQVHILAGRASSDPPTIKVFTPEGKEKI
ncbi:MAG: VCBS repeat-containing protein, partial [bacterium]|nr:VCBS repeat-containing protein [bacterium]